MHTSRNTSGILGITAAHALSLNIITVISFSAAKWCIADNEKGMRLAQHANAFLLIELSSQETPRGRGIYEIQSSPSEIALQIYLFISNLLKRIPLLYANTLYVERKWHSSFHSSMRNFCMRGSSVKGTDGNYCLRIHRLLKYSICIYSFIGGIYISMNPR